MRRTFRSMVAILAASTTLGLVGPGAVISADASALNPQRSSRWRACDKKLDGIVTRLARSQRTVTIVNQTSQTHARVSFWVRTNSRCSLSRKFLTKQGRLGYGGTVDGRNRKQGSGTTPLGTYTMTEAFGNGPAPSMWLPYHRVKKGDYWVGDNASRYYNSVRNKSQGGFRYRLSSSSADQSEYLPHFTKQYRYAVVINFNRAPDHTKAHRGTGIFLHVSGSGATAGCVAITAHQMRTVMAYLKSGDRITIAG
jgi:L,D-peptidoglycan transpeptidase YkuD (ErfK/YbiS/YcfS/YnhG family)